MGRSFIFRCTVQEGAWVSTPKLRLAKVETIDTIVFNVRTIFPISQQLLHTLKIGLSELFLYHPGSVFTPLL